MAWLNKFLQQQPCEAAVEELSEMVFSMWSMIKLYRKNSSCTLVAKHNAGGYTWATGSRGNKHENLALKAGRVSNLR
jgi:hypothetical protein